MEKNIIEKKTQDNCDFYYATPNSRIFLMKISIEIKCYKHLKQQFYRL